MYESIAPELPWFLTKPLPAPVREVTHNRDLLQLLADYEGLRLAGRTPQALTVEKLRADGNVDVTWLGWPSRTYTNSWSVYIDSSYAESQWIGPFPAQKPGTLVDRFKATVQMPRGLGKANDDDSVNELTRRVELQ